MQLSFVCWHQDILHTVEIKVPKVANFVIITAEFTRIVDIVKEEADITTE